MFASHLDAVQSHTGRHSSLNSSSSAASGSLNGAGKSGCASKPIRFFNGAGSTKGSGGRSNPIGCLKGGGDGLVAGPLVGAPGIRSVMGGRSKPTGFLRGPLGTIGSGGRSNPIGCRNGGPAGVVPGVFGSVAGLTSGGVSKPMGFFSGPGSTNGSSGRSKPIGCLKGGGDGVVAGGTLIGGSGIVAGGWGTLPGGGADLTV